LHVGVDAEFSLNPQEALANNIERARKICRCRSHLLTQIEEIGNLCFRRRALAWSRNDDNATPRIRIQNGFDLTNLIRTSDTCAAEFRSDSAHRGACWHTRGALTSQSETPRLLA